MQRAALPNGNPFMPIKRLEKARASLPSGYQYGAVRDISALLEASHGLIASHVAADDNRCEGCGGLRDSDIRGWCPTCKNWRVCID